MCDVVWCSILSALTDASNRERSCTERTTGPAMDVSPALKNVRPDVSDSGVRKTVMFSCVERPSARSAYISWYDPTFGHYTDQRWALGVSRSKGFCALTGRLVSPGDAVFRPVVQYRMSPCNAGAMILEESINEAQTFLRLAKGA